MIIDKRALVSSELESHRMLRLEIRWRIPRDSFCSLQEWTWGRNEEYLENLRHVFNHGEPQNPDSLSSLLQGASGEYIFMFYDKVYTYTIFEHTETLKEAHGRLDAQEKIKIENKELEKLIQLIDNEVIGRIIDEIIEAIKNNRTEELEGEIIEKITADLTERIVDPILEEITRSITSNILDSFLYEDTDDIIICLIKGIDKENFYVMIDDAEKDLFSSLSFY